MGNLSSRNLNHAKAAAGQKAAELVLNGMSVGLGTGSTAFYFIESLSQRCKKGLKIQAYASSEKSAEQARRLGLVLGNINEITTLDLTIDGADEIDSRKRMIKGGGGALLREKIIASMSSELIIIVDETKVVKDLGAFPLPVEVVPFAHKAIISKLNQRGYYGKLRYFEEGLYLTDNGNYIFDIEFTAPCSNPEKDHEIIRSIPGVVETGFFFNLAGRVFIGHRDGNVEMLK
jgi:ribose 5-phosphate isomerase A